MKKIYLLLLFGILCVFANSQPNSFSTTVSSEHGDLDLVLYKYNVRGENFQVYTYDGNRLTPYTPPDDIRTYRGYIANKENAKVVAVWYPNNRLFLKVLYGKGDIYSFEMSNINTSSLNIKKLDLPIVSEPQKAGMHFTSGFTTTHEWFNRDYPNGDINLGIAMFEFSVCQIDYVMARDIGASFELTLLVIPTSSSVTNRTIFKPRNSNHPGLIETRTWWNAFGSGGGSATKNYCSGFYQGGRTAFNEVSMKAIAHELGHSFSLHHYNNQHDAMHSNQFFLGRESSIRSRVHLGKGDCLNVANSNYTDPLQPYAPEDYFIGDFNQPVTLDVMANDADYNGDDISIREFDKKSEFGGKIVQVDDKLVYTPPKNFVGRDYLNYQIHSGAEGSPEYMWSQAKVMVDVRKDRGLALHYKFEETDGFMIYDQAWGNSQHHGRAFGTALDQISAPGKLGKGIRINGENTVEIQDVLDPLNKSLTVSIWFKLDGRPSGNTVLFDSGSGYRFDNSNSGLSIWVTDNQIRFHARQEDKAADRYRNVSWQTNKWYHAVLVIDRKKNKVFGYLDGKEVGSSSNNGQGLTQDGFIKGYSGIKHNFLATRLGASARHGRYNFTGSLDEFKIFNKALSSNEVEDEFENPGGNDYDCPKGLFKKPISNGGFEKIVLKPGRESVSVEYEWVRTVKNGGRASVLWADYSGTTPDAPEKDNWCRLQGEVGIYQQIGTWKDNEEFHVNLSYGKLKNQANTDLEVSIWVGGSRRPGHGDNLGAIGATKLDSKVIPKSELDNKEVVDKKLSFKLGTQGKDCQPIWLLLKNHNTGSGDVNLVDKINVYNDDVLVVKDPVSDEVNALVYPIPTTDMLNVNIPNDLKVKITTLTISDQIGKIMKSYRGLTNENLLDVSYLKPGIYFITIKTNKGVIVKKISKI